MKKVLFLSYYWPPSGKASLQWPLKVIQYLPEFGIEPIVITVENDSFSQKDISFQEQISPLLKVIKTQSWEPFELYKKFTGKSSDDELVASETISKENKSLTHRLSIWLRMNIFVPDARIGWYPFTVKACKKIIAGQKIDAIITNGPPHSVHLIGHTISKKFSIPHIPVFIDPWIDIAYYEGFKRSFITRTLDASFEKKTVTGSRINIFVTKSMQEDFIRKYPGIADKSHVLYWGYNEDSFTNLHLKTSNSTKVLVHAGNIFDNQNPAKLWSAIKRRIQGGENIRIRFIGTVGPAIKKSISETGLDAYTEYAGFLPYKEMLQSVMQADYLLVCPTEKRHVPGKLFEYLRSGNPIIAIGDENVEVKSILSNSNAGMFLTPQEDPAVFFTQAGEFHTNINYVKQFDRKSITQKFSILLNKI